MSPVTYSIEIFSSSETFPKCGKCQTLYVDYGKHNVYVCIVGVYLLVDINENVIFSIVDEHLENTLSQDDFLKFIGFERIEINENTKIVI